MNKPISMFLALLTVVTLRAAETIVTSPMVGKWEGNAHVIVNWCKQTNLPVKLEIGSDGTVSGNVGDAVLVKGRLRGNRGWLAGKLNWKTDYIIEGRLTGAIVASENISRTGVKMPLNFNGTTFTGGVHTSGRKVGGKERMILSASRLVLQCTNRGSRVLFF